MNLATEAEVASEWVSLRSAEVPVEIQGKATSSRLLDFTSPPMRAFQIAWVALLLWFGIVNRNALVAVSRIVGAGRKAGAVAAGLLFKGSLDWSTGLLILGIAVTVSSCLALTLKLIPETQPAAEPAPMPSELAAAVE